VVHSEMPLPRINLFCDPFGITGYQVHATEMLRAMLLEGWDVGCIPLAPFAATAMDSHLYDAIMRATVPRAGCFGIKISWPMPHLVNGFSGKARVFFTLSEVDRLPPSSVDALNTVDEVWTASEWGRAVFVESGVKKPVRVVPEGFDPSLFRPTDKARGENERFRFFVVGKFEERKNYRGLLRAYADEFRSWEKVELLVHCGGDNSITRAKDLIRTMHFKCETPPIRFSQPVASRTAMAALFQSADAFVLPTRGEGFAVHRLEAMDSGPPVTTAGLDSLMEYAVKDTAMLLNYELVPAEDPGIRKFDEFFKWGRWAEPDVNQLRRSMRFLYESREEGKRMGERASRHILKNWTWSHALRKMRKILEELSG